MALQVSLPDADGGGFDGELFALLFALPFVLQALHLFAFELQFGDVDGDARQAHGHALGIAFGDTACQLMAPIAVGKTIACQLVHHLGAHQGLLVGLFEQGHVVRVRDHAQVLHADARVGRRQTQRLETDRVVMQALLQQVQPPDDHVGKCQRAFQEVGGAVFLR